VIVSDWSLGEDGHPRGLGGHPVILIGGPHLPGGAFSCLLESSFTYVGLFSLCKHDMWAFLGSFLITPCRNRHSPKLVEFYQCNPYL
jgi:hypothetical protein